MSVTPFNRDGGVDEGALRAHLERLASAKVSVYVASAGSGESHALTAAEITRIYEVSVSACAGRVRVFAAPPEPRTAVAMIEQAQRAIDAGVDCVQIFALDVGHGVIPDRREQERYYDEVLEAIRHPVTISYSTVSAWQPSVDLIGRLCREYPHIENVSAIGTPQAMIRLRDLVDRRVAIFGTVRNLLQDLMLGFDGVMSAEANICPNLLQAIVAGVVEGRYQQATDAFRTLLRLYDVITSSGGRPGSPPTFRRIKPALEYYGLPGGGPMRLPHLGPDEQEAAEIRRALGSIDLSAYGLASPSRS